ncbi:hypothetical protein CEW88_04865 [Alloyangia pacifica]|uniref:Uncharacterized protein n=1 Tax=Alloyangia pacifica TaxID=311180 RepID=A0A2U8HFL4_9RHOB|nr:hypothetical protein CEW88_04865 [Alloyangia pacifica]
MIAVALSLTAALAQEFEACAPRGTMVEMLSEVFGEEPRAIGLTGDERMMELFVSEAGTWTILLTTATGISCPISEGSSFERRTPPGSGPTW